MPGAGQAPHREHGGRRMVERFRRSFKGKRRLVAAGIAVAALAGALAAMALPATTSKPYHAAITVSAPVPPDTTPAAEAWAGSQPTVTVTITNDSNPQALGSANIQVPAGIPLAAPAISSNQAPFTGTVTQSGSVPHLRRPCHSP